jgi:hypothetical protein
MNFGISMRIYFSEWNKRPVKIFFKKKLMDTKISLRRLQVKKEKERKASKQLFHQTYDEGDMNV